MRYSLFDIEVTAPFDDLRPAPGDAGAAVLIRRKGIPVGFWMQRSIGEAELSAAAVARRVREIAGAKIVAEALREELTPVANTLPLPLLTVAICTKDRPAGVERVLRSLRGQKAGLPPGSAGLDILVVDNAPSDARTRDLVSQWPHVRYVREPRPGLDFARNVAVREARGDLLAFLDDDVVVDRFWSAGLADAWSENQDAACFTGMVMPLELETEAQILFEVRGGFRRGFDRIRYGQVLPGNRLYPGEAGIFGTGANMAFRTDLLRALGGFDEALDTGASVPGGGDLDIYYRIIRAGFPLVYEPRMLVFHQHRREIEALRLQYRRSWGYGFMCYLTKCFRTDPERRIHLLRLLVWWFARGAGEVVRNRRCKKGGQAYLPPGMIVGEMAGAVAGLLGGYGRSLRRTKRIASAFASSSEAQ